MSYSTYTLERLKASETKMHAQDIIKRQQEEIELLISRQNVLKARVKQLEQENTELYKRISPVPTKLRCHGSLLG